MIPYYSDEFVTIYLGDSRDLAGDFAVGADVLLTDPPYGVDYQSGSQRLPGNARSIEGDKDTTARDQILDEWGCDRPALVFGHRTIPAPVATRLFLTWDKGPALGMGDLSLPWKPSTEEIYVLGSGFVGRRDMGSVYTDSPVQSVGRVHPHQKPVSLMKRLLLKCPDGLVFDPFMGSGPVLRAAKDLGRRAIGIEIDEGYCEAAALSCAQDVLPFDS